MSSRSTTFDDPSALLSIQYKASNEDDGGDKRTNGDTIGKFTYTQDKWKLVKGDFGQVYVGRSVTAGSGKTGLDLVEVHYYVDETTSTAICIVVSVGGERYALGSNNTINVNRPSVTERLEGYVYARMESGSGNGDRTMLELLNQLDGFEASNKNQALSACSIFIELYKFSHFDPSDVTKMGMTDDLEASLQVLRGLYEYLHALSEVNPHVAEISMTCRLRIYNYEKVVARIAHHLNLDDPSKIRLTSHNWCIKKPEREPIKYRGVGHLSNMLTLNTWVYDSSTLAFWSKSSVDIEPRRIRLQSNSYTTNTLLDTITAETFQQTDIHSPTITIHESLIYSAFLRLPKEIGKEPDNNGSEVQNTDQMDHVSGVNNCDLDVEEDYYEDEYSDSEYVSIQRPAFYVTGEPDFDSGPPQDGLEYLRRVRRYQLQVSKGMLHYSVVYKFPSTNNQLRTSSNPRNQPPFKTARLLCNKFKGGKDKVMLVLAIRVMLLVLREIMQEGRQGWLNVIIIKVKVTWHAMHHPKMARNAEWFKEKAMLAEAQESGQILDEEQLAFLADLGIPDGQAA
ncbi:GEM-associated protein 2 [Tanacetum coccineum]